MDVQQFQSERARNNQFNMSEAAAEAAAEKSFPK